MQLTYRIVFLAHSCVFVAAINSLFRKCPPNSEPSFLASSEPPSADLFHYMEPCCRYETISTDEDERIAAECVTEVENKYGLKTSDEDVAGAAPAEDRQAFSKGEMNVFSNRSVADSDGNIIPQEAVKLMKSVISVTDETVWGAVERICTKVKPATEKFYLCNPDAMEFKYCVYFLVDLHCPENLQRKSESCDAYRQELKRRYSVE